MDPDEKSNRRLLIPATLLPLSVVAPFVAALSLVDHDFDTFGVGALLVFLVFAALAMPFFLTSFVWFLVTLLRRRPVRSDKVAIAVWVITALTSALLALFAFSAPAYYRMGAYWAFCIEAALGLLGLAGLAVCVLSLVPKRAAASPFHSPEL